MPSSCALKIGVVYNQAVPPPPLTARMASENNADWFVYTGQPIGDIPRDVTHVRIDPSVTVIAHGAFKSFCELVEVEFSGRVEKIGVSAFYGCSSLKAVTLHDGLVEIGNHAFRGFALNNINLPSSLRRIRESALPSLQSLHLPDGVESIGANAFVYGRFTNVRIPPLITTISMCTFSYCSGLFSVELPESLAEIEYGSFEYCRSMRNMAIPSGAETSREVFNYCSDLLKLFDSEERITEQLKHRFDGLPIHKMLYYQSYHPVTTDRLNNATNMRSGHTRALRSKLDPTGREQDCLGMTPLHILACSSIQELSIYELMINKYPENLTTKDRWGALPILYAVWGDAPSDVIQFLVGCYQSIHPNFELNWNVMITALGKGDALDAIQRLLDLKESSFPGQTVDWNSILNVFPAEDGRLLAAEKTFRFLMMRSVASRVNAIGVKSWRGDLENMTTGTSYIPDRHHFISEVHSKLASYESEYQKLKEATTVLELAVWKANIVECTATVRMNSKRLKRGDIDFRHQCRVSCGSHILVSNVVQYLYECSEE